jgi:DNA-binding CsgD family transcriptional regulator/predicted enzyme related to lactoylglutathione lyase
MPRTTRGRPPHDDLLTPAEWRVLHAVQHGLSNRAIATRMGLGVDAIKYHVRNILAKTGRTNRKGLKLFFQVPKASNPDQTRQEASMPATSALGTIGQISRTVSDIQSARNWYELVLELPHMFTFDTLSFFNCNGTRLMLTQEGELNPHESVLYFKVDDIAGTYESLRGKGVEFIAAPHRIHRHDDGTEEWMGFFKDPDGRTLALMAQVKGQN